MRGDFSQLYADDASVIGVLHQQGRAIRDADLNEQTLRFWRMITTMAQDLTELKSLQPRDSAQGLSGCVYVEGVRVDLSGLPREKVKEKTHVEVQVATACAIQHSRYADNALREGLFSGVRLAIKPRLRGGEPPASPPAAPPTLTFTPLSSNLGNRLYRFEVFKEGGNIKIKWSDDNASRVYAVSLPDADVPPLPTHEWAPRIATKVRSVNLSGNAGGTLAKGTWIEFLRPANTSLLSEHEPMPIQIDDVKNGAIAFAGDGVPIELDSTDNSSPHAAFVVWRDVRELKDDGSFTIEEEFTCSASINKVDIPYGASWTVEVRNGDERGTGRKGLFHRSKSFAKLVLPVVPPVAPPSGGGVSAVPLPADVAVGNPLRPPASNPESRTGLAVSDMAPQSPLIGEIPLRLLDLALDSPPLRQWVASADLSEAAFLPADELIDKLLRSIDVPHEERAAFEAGVHSLARQVDRIAQRLSISSDEAAFA